MGDQHGFFQNVKSVQLEETKKVESQCVRDNGGRLLRDRGRIRERWLRFFRSLLNLKSDILDPVISKRLPQQVIASALGIKPTREEIATAMKTMTKEKAVGAARASQGTETRTPTRPDHPTGVPSTHHPHLARRESPTAVERRGHYRAPQEKRQDVVRKLPRHLARVTRG